MRRIQRSTLRAAINIGTSAFLAMLTLLVSCSSPTGKKPNATPTESIYPTATMQTHPNFPAFSDWRVGYEASDGHLHAITLDGKTDVIGPELPGLNPTHVVFHSAGTSSDGQYLMYGCSGSGFVDLHATANSYEGQFFTPEPGDYAMYWSPDGSQIARKGEGNGVDDKIVLYHLSNHQVQIMPVPNVDDSHLDLWGWLDASHVFGVAYIQGATSATSLLKLEAINVKTGAIRVISTHSYASVGLEHYLVAPDGAHILYYNEPVRDDPFTPVFEVIDSATGAAQSLPHIQQQLPGNYRSFPIASWQPGRNIVAISTGFVETSNLQSWILNLDSDSAVPFLDNQYVQGWSPDGKTLIVSSWLGATASGGPSDLSAVTFTSDWKPSVTLLTQDAISFPFAGFVRSAP